MKLPNQTQPIMRIKSMAQMVAGKGINPLSWPFLASRECLSCLNLCKGAGTRIRQQICVAGCIDDCFEDLDPRSMGERINTLWRAVGLSR